MKYVTLIPVVARFSAGHLTAVLTAPLLAAVFMASGHAQERMYRCDNNYYTNSNATADPKARGCKLLEGGNVTVVQGTRPTGASAGVGPVAAAQPVKIAGITQVGGQRNDGGGSRDTGLRDADQRARDADARQILETELRRAEARQSDLAREYNNGEPEKQGIEFRNYQRYQDRVAEMKSGMARNESDIAGIRRELGRAGGAPAAPSGAGGSAATGAK